jgi:hypothetical protein
VSPAHRAALRFLRGGLVATVALLAPSQIGFLAHGAPWLSTLAGVVRVMVPALGFAAGGAIGATALDRGWRGIGAFAAGFFATGLAMSLGAPLVTGLTGFEHPGVVLLFAGASTAAAFGAGGLVAGLAIEPRRACGIALGAASGGVLGGLVTVLPAVAAGVLSGWPAEARLLVRLSCSLVGFLVPFAIAGAVAGRALER